MNETIDRSYVGEGIYREFIIDHYKNPRNAGGLENATFQHRELNPLCGDELTFFVHLQDGKIADVRFQGKGCAISQASASILSETVKDKTIEEVKAMQREQMLELLGIPVGPVRVKCAMLGLVTLKNGIHQYEQGAHHG